MMRTVGRIKEFMHMDNLMQVPEWLGAAVIGAVVAALGYVGKLIIESWLGIREAQNGTCQAFETTWSGIKCLTGLSG